LTERRCAIAKLLHVILAAGLLGWCTGCATAVARRYPNATYPPGDPATVEIFNHFPPTPYEVIGEVEYNGAPLARWGGAWQKLRQEAAAIGGDAVVIQVRDTPYVGSLVQPGEITGNTSGTLSANTYGSGTYAHTTGTYQDSSNYQYTPPTVTPMYGKYVSGVVIKFKRSEAR